MALLTDIVAYWKLDEAAGNSRNDSVGSNHLSQVNTVNSISGKLSNAAEFVVANSSYLSIADNANISVGNIDFTFAGWFNLANRASSQDLINKYNNYSTGNREFSLIYDSATSGLTWIVSPNGSGTTSVKEATIGVPDANTWYFFVVDHRASTDKITVQINNGTVHETGYGSGVFDGNSPLIFGALPAASRFSSARLDGIGFWKRLLTTEERTSLYNSGTGLDYPFGEISDSISITSPGDYRVFQRSGSTGDIVISGTFTGTPTAIEASWNGGAYETIDNSPTDGEFSGSLTGKSQGQGSLIVRFTNSTGVNATSVYVGIGDIFCIAGQSNADGYGTNNHTYSSALKASMSRINGTWEELSDPTSEVSGAGGSVWPEMATIFLADQSVPLAFIPCSSSGSSISDWSRNESNHSDGSTLYGKMYSRIISSGGVKAVLWWQGESEAAAGTSYATCLSSYRTLVNNIYEDFGVQTVMAQIGDRSTTDPVTRLDAVRLAQSDLWAEEGNALPGPVLYDVALTVDGVHFKTDAEQLTASKRWWNSISNAFYSGTYGRGPILLTCTHNAGRSEVYLKFIVGTIPISPDTGIGGIVIYDSGSSVSLARIERSSPDTINISLSAPAIGQITVSLGQGRTGTGAVIPKDSCEYALPAEIFISSVSAVRINAPEILLMA